YGPHMQRHLGYLPLSTPTSCKNHAHLRNDTLSGSTTAPHNAPRSAPPSGASSPSRANVRATYTVARSTTVRTGYYPRDRQLSPHVFAPATRGLRQSVAGRR